MLGGEKQSKPVNNRKDSDSSGLLTLISQADHIPFRKPMSWFVKSDIGSEKDSLTSSTIVRSLWTKGAEMLF